MTQERSRLPGSTLGATSPRENSDVQVGRTAARANALLSLTRRPTAPPVVLGLAVATLLILAESLLVYLLKEAAPGNVFGVVFVLGVLVVSTLWGFWLGAMTSLASAAVYAYFHHLQTGVGIITASTQNWVAITVFLVVALLAASLAGAVRSRAAEADSRRREAEANHTELSVLAEHQDALRRVATLVARGVPPSELFGAVAEELARCLGVYHHAVLFRYQPDGAGVLLAAGHGDRALDKIPVGERFSLEGESVAATVFRTGRAARMGTYENTPGSIATRFRDLGLYTAVGAPIIVDGRLWGAAIVGSRRAEPLPPETEALIADFTDLVATAVANAQTRAELRVLAEQQASLRRVAELVARGVSPSEVFSAVAGELAQCLGVQHSTLFRYEAGRTAELLAVRHERELAMMPIGQRFSFEGDNVAALVYDTGRTARIDSHDNASGLAAAYVRQAGIRSSVGAPIIVEGGLWGVAIVGWSRAEPLPPDTEQRVGDFADLVATAIANAQAHADLTASRARIVAAADEARRRFERDLHDGAQQRLVALGLELRAAEACVPDELQPLRAQISRLVSTVAGVSADVQEISRGMHPGILSKGGLGPALKALARRSTIPVDLDLHVDRRLPDSVEVAAYYVLAEALTNTAKHARASVVEVCAQVEAPNLRLTIRDDGVGGAGVGKGSGLIGLIDRVEALGGHMTIFSQAGSGTSLLVNIPFEVQ